MTPEEEALASGQPRKFQSRAAARRAYDKDVQLDKTAHRETVSAWWRGLVERCKDLPEPVASIAEVHMPSTDEFASTYGPNCPECRDSCGDGEDAPCETLTLIVRHYFPAHGDDNPERFQPQRQFSDYWADPMVTVTFAFWTEFLLPDGQIKHVNPLDQHTMPLSAAEKFYSRLLKTSMDRVDRLVGR